MSFATKEGTEKYFHFHEVHPDKKKKFDSLHISALGIGTYLGDVDDRSDALYENAIALALTNGINCIDTAINYRCQRSERIIGLTLKNLKDHGISRDQIIISTKGGFIPIEDPNQSYEAYIRKNYIEKKIIKQSDIIHDNYCMSPAFLGAEIDKSLQNLEIECIDLYYLQNPEVQLFEFSREEFDDRMHQIFSFLEKKVKEGKIRRYGISTWNGFRQKKETKGLLDLNTYLDFAKKISEKKHHFKAIQLPINLIMLEAFKVPNQKDEESILTAAFKKGIQVFASAPLMQSHILNLPQRVFDLLPNENTLVLKAFQFILSDPRITGAFVGMKSAVHVHENIKTLALAKWPVEDFKNAGKILGTF